MQTDKLYEASANGDVDVLRSLIRNDNFILDRISVLTCCNETPLHIAAMRGHQEFVRALVRDRQELASIVDIYARSPLHLACARGHIEIVKELVMADSQVCVSRDRDGNTPIHLAAMNEQVDVIRALLEMMAPELARESIMMDDVILGETILHLCVKHRRVKSLKLLVEWHWSDGDMIVNSKDHDGNTILHLAAMLKDVQTTKYLLSRTEIKTKANAVNDSGFTALDVLEQCPASNSKSQEIIRKLLYEAGIIGRGDLNIVPCSLPAPSTSILLPVAISNDDEDTSNPPQSSCIPLPPTKKKTRNKLYQQPDHHAYTSQCGTGKVQKIALRLWRKIKADSDWLEEVRGNLMVAATVTATMAFQAGLNPPGGVWQDFGEKMDNEFGKNVTFTAGYSIASTRLPDDYELFMNYNTVSLVASLSTILLMISGFPLKCRLSMLLLMVTMCTTVVFILLTYLQSIQLVTADNESFESTWKVSQVSSWVWIGLCSIVVLLYIVRLFVWLLAKLSRFLPRIHDFEFGRRLLSSTWENITHRTLR